jgi:hypothetical protein
MCRYLHDIVISAHGYEQYEARESGRKFRTSFP